MSASGELEQKALSTTELENLLEEMRCKISSGTHWYLAILETIGKWKYPEEAVDSRFYRYLIGGEAFDWLLLASRLSQALDGAVPEEEKESLLFTGREPVPVSLADFKNYLGSVKYKAYLNYYYGVEVEEALINAVEEEVRKEEKALGFVEPDEDEICEKAFKRLYKKGFISLLEEYRKEKGLAAKGLMALYEWKEFIYWLFCLRLRLNEKARCASDTRKALQEIQKQRSTSLYSSYGLEV